MFIGSYSPLWPGPNATLTGSGSDPLHLGPSSHLASYRQMHDILSFSDGLRAIKPGSHRNYGVLGQSAAIQSLQNSGVLVTDMLYPSVIPLPGTLPQTPGHPSLSPGANSSKSSDNSPRSPDSPSPRSPEERRSFALGPPPLVTTSSQLKFGIDTILNDKEEKLKKEECPKEVEMLPSPRALPPMLSPCPCSNSSCAFVLSQLPFIRHPPPSAFPGLTGYTHGPPDFADQFSMTTAADGSHHLHPNHQQPKRKRSWSRAVFSNLQRKGLEKRFEVQKYVTKPDRRQLAAMLGLTDAQVKVWFQNRRMKWRHQEEAKRKKEEEDKKKDGNEHQEVDNHERTDDSRSSSPHQMDIADGDSDIDVGRMSNLDDDVASDLDDEESIMKDRNVIFCQQPPSSQTMLPIL